MYLVSFENFLRIIATIIYFIMISEYKKIKPSNPYSINDMVNNDILDSGLDNMLNDPYSYFNDNIDKSEH